MSQAQLASASPSVSLVAGRPATTSLEVAKFFGKRHDHVVRSIKDLMANCPESFTAPNFGVSEYIDETGRALPLFILYRDGFMLLVMGYTGKKALAVKLAYIDAFNKMEAQLAEKPQAIPQKTTPSTAESRKPLRSLVHAWAQVTGVHHAALWPQVKAHFQLSRIDDLPDEWMPDALAFVQAKIDEAGRAPYSLPEPAAPAMPAPSIPADDRHFAVAAELKAIAQRLEQLCPDVARANYPRFCDRSEREQNRYEMQASLYRMGNASLRTAIASLTASWQVWEMMS